MEREMSHCTLAGELYHVLYEWTTTKKGMVKWHKVYGAETKCLCHDREADRIALKRVKEVVND